MCPCIFKMPNLCHSQRTFEMQTVIPYKITKRGELHIRPEPTTLSSSTNPSANKALFMFWLMQTEMVITLLLLSRLFLPMVHGFHASLHVDHGKSKAYFHMSYDQSPNKSVINNIMNKFLGGRSSCVCLCHSDNSVK